LIAIEATPTIVLQQTICAIMVLELEPLVQIAPAIILGLRGTDFCATPIMVGIVIGSLVVVVMKSSAPLCLSGMSFLRGVHAAH